MPCAALPTTVAFATSASVRIASSSLRMCVHTHHRALSRALPGALPSPQLGVIGARVGVSESAIAHGRGDESCASSGVIAGQLGKQPAAAGAPCQVKALTGLGACSSAF